MDATPIEARCDHCKQTRPLFLFEPDHDFHLTGITCEWCRREKQPLLCVRCFSAETLREEADPGSPEDNALAAALIEATHRNARIIARQEADKAACDGIAEATRNADA
ncbi:hypothetical protein G3I43_07080 [Streptomyces anulatus]|uniref:Uncharacterized protein n=1 Tax=Streptomyces anulatus TaxID=1892 RepID=A0A6G3SMG4_STRAQ|nr:hypothetical protein [Streptomyces anulatus]NEB83942.1 hypothetical protein [Streptomyces anulatus]